MRLPGADGQPFTHSAPVLKDRAIRVVFGPEALRKSHPRLVRWALGS